MTSPLPAAKGYTAIDCRILHRTEKALLISVEHLTKEIWLPLSQIAYIHKQDADIHNINPDYTDVIHVADWLVSKNDLEE